MLWGRRICFAAGESKLLLPGLDKAKSMPAERQKLLVTSEASVSALRMQIYITQDESRLLEVMEGAI